MSRGRKPKPFTLAAIEGGRTPDAVPQPERLVDVACPDDLDGAARECWNQLAPDLVRVCGMSAVDLVMFRLFCESYGRYKDLERQLVMYGDGDAVTNSDGEEIGRCVDGKTTYTVTGRNGTQFKTRPEYHQLMNELQVMKSIAGEFGITPAARVRLKGMAQLDLFDDALTSLDEALGNGGQGNGSAA